VAATSRHADKRARRAARSTELELGDVVAIDGGREWGAAVVVDHMRDMGGRLPIVEMLDWRGKRAPALDALEGRRAAGAHGLRYRVAIDLWTRDDKQGRWRTIGRSPAPDG